MGLGRRALLAASLALPAAALPAAARAAGGSVLRFIPESPLVVPDPIAVPSMAGRSHAMMVWDQLYGQTASGEALPQMAEGHEAGPDGLLWRFTLREGLRFHDGTPVTAADCVASIRRWGARRPFGQKLLAAAEAIAALDARRFEIRLHRPFPMLLAALAGDTCFIMPRALAETDPARPVPRVIGSGPFSFVAEEFVPGSRAAYARFPGYLPAPGLPDFTAGPKRALVERVEWTAMDPEAAVAALAAGRADWWENPPVEQHEALRRLDGVRLETNPEAGAMPILQFNHLEPPFSNRRLLRALLPALDQGEFMTAAMAAAPALARIGVGYFSPGSPAASDAGMDVLTGPRDVERARREVQEAGYAGETAVILSPTDVPRLRALAEVTSDLFQRVGLIVEVAEMDWATLLQRRRLRGTPAEGGWSAFCTTFPALSLASPASSLPLRGAGEAGWFGWPTSARLERLRDAWFSATSDRARARICAEIQVAALHAVPYLPLGEWLGTTALRAGVRGVARTPFPIFWGVDTQ